MILRLHPRRKVLCLNLSDRPPQPPSVKTTSRRVPNGVAASIDSRLGCTGKSQTHPYEPAGEIECHNDLNI